MGTTGNQGKHRLKPPARAAAALLLCGTLALAGCAGAGQSPVQEQQGRAAILDGCASVEVPEGWEWEYLDWPSLGEAGYPEDAFLRVYDPAGGYYDDPRETSGKSPRVAVYLETSEVREDGAAYLRETASRYEQMTGIRITWNLEERDGAQALDVEERYTDEEVETYGWCSWHKQYLACISTASGPDIVVMCDCSLWTPEEAEKYADTARGIYGSLQLHSPYTGHVDEDWIPTAYTTVPYIADILDEDDLK